MAGFVISSLIHHGSGINMILRPSPKSDAAGLSRRYFSQLFFIAGSERPPEASENRFSVGAALRHYQMALLAIYRKF